MAKLNIEIPTERVKATLNIKKSSHMILEEYAKYASDLYNAPVSKDAIIDSLLEKLSKEKDFKEKMKIKN